MTMVDGTNLVENAELVVAILKEIITSAKQVAGPSLSRRDPWVKNSEARVNELNR